MFCKENCLCNIFFGWKLSLVYDQFAFYVSESRSIDLFVWFMSHLLNKSAHSPPNSTFFWPHTTFCISILLNWKGRNLYVLVEFIFLAVMARLAAGKDLTFKVQNTPRNKFAFQSSSQNSLNPIESTQRMLNFLRNLRKKCLKSAKNTGQFLYKCWHG